MVFDLSTSECYFHSSKPDYFVSSLLGHEGVGSLFSYLKERGFANALGGM